jgi:hypothetical protein
MKEQYQKLFQLIGRVNDNKSFNLEEVLKESVAFFESIRIAYAKASKEEKHELMHMMNTLYSRLQETSKQFGEKIGMSDDKLKEYTENPNNFSPEQWQFLQSSKGQLHESVRKFNTAVKERPAAVKARSSAKSKSIKRRNWA